VSWETYCALLRETGDDRKCRMAFSDGELEIMAPLGEHENIDLTIHEMIVALLRELKMPHLSLGHMTLTRAAVKKGIEPDLCYHIQSYPLMRGKRGRELDSPDNPVPDLMVEVDVHNTSLNKLELCERLGVPEHWRVKNGKLEIRILKNGRYERSETSAAFPDIRVQKIVELLEDTMLESYERATVFQEWIRSTVIPRRAPGSGPV
jgi:Uma2 family endonuclease